MSGRPRAIRHGTIGGYVTHKRRGEAACGSCTAAWRMYYQDRNGSKPMRVFLRDRATEKHVKTLRKAAKARECEVRKVKRREARRLAEEAQREQADHQDQTVGVGIVDELPAQDGLAVRGGLGSEEVRPGPPAEQG